MCVRNYGGTNGRYVHHYPYQMVLVRVEAQLETTLICTCPRARDPPYRHDGKPKRFMEVLGEVEGSSFPFY